MRTLWSLTVLALTACTTVGQRFDVAQVDTLKPGVSTVADARQVLGPPTADSAMPNGARLLQWQYSRGTLVGGSGAHVAILFDAAGAMVRVTHRMVLP